MKCFRYRILLYLLEVYKKLELTISIEFSYTKDFNVFKYFRMLAFDRKLFAKDIIYTIIYYDLFYGLLLSMVWMACEISRIVKYLLTSYWSHSIKLNNSKFEGKNNFNYLFKI